MRSSKRVSLRTYRLTKNRGGAIVVFDDAREPEIGDAATMKLVLDFASDVVAFQLPNWRATPITALTCARRLAEAGGSWQKLPRLEIVDALRKTPSRKVRKVVLRQQFKEAKPL